MFLWRRLRGTQPLLSGSVFEYDNRPSRDAFFGLVYMLCLGLTITGGIVGIVNRNQQFDILDRETFLNDPSNCPVAGLSDLLEKKSHNSQDFDPTFFIKSAGVLLSISLAASLLVSLAFLALVKYNAHMMVSITVALQVGLPLLGALSALQAGNQNAGCALLITATTLGIFFLTMRKQLDLVGRLLSLAARAMQDNPGIIGFSIFMKACLLALTSFLGLSIFGSLLNGNVLPNPARHGHAVCKDFYGESVSCCVWQPSPWVAPFLPLASAMLAWTVLLLFEIKVFTVSGVVAQWYFTPVGSSSSYSGNTLRSMKHALGASFGSLCVGSAVLLVLSRLRQVAAKLRQRRAGGLISCLLSGVLTIVYTLLEGITKFATVRMAITGESFLTSGKAVVALLSRNALNTAGVWWLPGLVLQSCALLLSLGWGTAVYHVSKLVWGASGEAHVSSVVLAAVSVFFAWLMLGFFCSLLLNMVDALFVCYAMDKDRHRVSKPEVHEVFYMLPAEGGTMAAATAPPTSAWAPGRGAGPSSGAVQPAYAPPQLVPSYYPDHSVAYGVPVQSPPVGMPFMPPPPPPAAYAAPTAPPKG